MAPKQLPTGLYLLRSIEADKYIGHVPAPRGVGPEKLVVLPGGVRAPHFHFARRDDGTFVISVDGLSAIEIEGKVYVLSVPHGEASSWVVEEIPEPHIGFKYIIKTPSHPQGWAVNESKPYTQVFVDIFEHAAPENARFELVPIEKAEAEEAA